MGVITESLVAEARGGRVYLGGSGSKLTTTVLGAALLLSNPQNSGKNINLYKVTIASDSKVTGLFTYMWNPTSNLPSTVQDIAKAKATQPNTVATLKTGLLSNLPSGGSLLSFTTLVGTGDREVVDLPPIIIPEGNSFCVIAPMIAATSSINMYWFEDL